MTMRVAALYDIHGNLPALEAVLAEIGSVDLLVVGGDVVWGPWPQETMDALLSCGLPTTFIMGNADRDVFDRVPGDWSAENGWCADRLDEDHHAFLRTRPATASVDGVLYCHGSPRSDTETITTGTAEDALRVMCAGVKERTVVCGHTHAQFDRRIDPLRVVNAGSVGDPFGEPGAYWAVFDPEPELRFTPYDTDAAARAIRTSGFPSAAMLADQVRSPAPASSAAEWFT